MNNTIKWKILIIAVLITVAVILAGCPNPAGPGALDTEEEIPEPEADDPVPVTGVTLDHESISLSPGSTMQLTATVEPADADDKSVTWSVNYPNRISVDDNGLVTAIAEGVAVVTVTATDGGLKDICNVEVAYVPGEEAAYSAGSVSFSLKYVPLVSFKTGIADDGNGVVTNGYFIGETEVTYELWDAVYDWAVTNGYSFDNPGVMGDGSGDTNQHPVTDINWRDAIVWCNALTEYYNDQNGTALEPVYYYDSAHTQVIRDSLDDDSHTSEEGGDYTAAVNPNSGGFDYPWIGGNGFRLPTSDEWELAARYIEDGNGDGDINDSNESYPGDFASGGDADAYATSGASDYDGDGDTEYTADVAVYATNGTRAVKSKSNNAMGLYDMSGNVWELCSDWATVGSTREMKSGSFDVSVGVMQLGFEHNASPFYEDINQGLRIAIDTE